MPVAVTYPGVYIEEVPSGVRTITGVATSVTAFIGRAQRGPVNEPVVVNSFGDFERTFGGLSPKDPMSYAVRDFYQNGGSQAVIVRLYRAAPGPNDGVSRATVGGLKLMATDPGKWGDKLRVKIDTAGITAEVAAQYGLAPGDLFNISVFKIGGGNAGSDLLLERLINLSVGDNARRVDRVLAQQSQNIHIEPDPNPLAFPIAPASGDLTGGANSDPLSAALDFLGNEGNKTGMYALLKTDIFNLLCIPPDTREGDLPTGVLSDAMTFCVARRAMLIVDPPFAWSADPQTAATKAVNGLPTLNLSGTSARNAALYFPRVIESDPLRDGQLDTFVPCGIIAGVMARTDTQRGVWKAPAGLDAALNGVQGLAANLSDAENGMLNPLGINCLRSFPVTGKVVWGARTLRGADQLADEYKYVPVRRLALYIEESLYRGTQWVVFEPNDEPLWSQIRLNVGAFMHNLFRQGAFQGRTPREAYLVKCDSETTTQNDINLGIVNILVGFAPLKPAEFVIIKIQQLAGQIEV